MTSIFRSDDPTLILSRYAQVLNIIRAPAERNAELAALAAADPVAVWIAARIVSPNGLQNAPVAAAELGESAAALWGPLSDADQRHIRALCQLATGTRADGDASALALGEAWVSWFNADRFFDQIEAISRAMPPLRAEGDFASWQGWRVPVAALSFLLGYESRVISPPEGQEVDAARLTPWLFAHEGDLAIHLARRFQESELEATLLLAWLYVPGFEAYLAYGSLPDTLPNAVAKASPRLAAVYQTVNHDQMIRFAAAEEEMMQ